MSVGKIKLNRLIVSIIMAMASMSHNLQGTAMPITDDMWSDLWGIPAPGSNLDFTFDYVDLEADLYRMPTLALQSAQCLVST